ncbi:hypothetical protein V2J09_006842 [Rumex salicifolius]
MSSSSRDEYYDEVVRRMASLPRSLLGGFSRAMGIVGGGGGRRQDNHQYHHQYHHGQPLPLPPQQPPTAYPYYPQEPSLVQDEWSFLTTFESSYGQKHPFFYACRFNESLKLAKGDHKFLFMYLHYPDHSNLFTSSFCKETLGSELVIQFLDANFVSWGGLADRGEGLQMANNLRPSTFPFCAVIAPSADDNITVLQQIEGPVSPAELVEILQGTMEDQWVAFGSLRAKQEEKRRNDRRLREEQDEKERVKNLPSTSSPSQVQKPNEVAGKTSNQTLIRPNKVREAAKTSATTSTRENQNRSNVMKGKDTQVTQILIRFPNGERLQQSFSVSDKIQAAFRYVDSLGVDGVGKYRLVLSFPRKVYGVDQMNMSFKEAGLYPKATLFLEPL